MGVDIVYREKLSEGDLHKLKGRRTRKRKNIDISLAKATLKDLQVWFKITATIWECGIEEKNEATLQFIDTLKSYADKTAKAYKSLEGKK